MAEERENKRNAELISNRPPEAPVLSPEEKINSYLKKAKQDKSKEAEDMVVH